MNPLKLWKLEISPGYLQFLCNYIVAPFGKKRPTICVSSGSVTLKCWPAICCWGCWLVDSVHGRLKALFRNSLSWKWKTKVLSSFQILLVIILKMVESINEPDVSAFYTQITEVFYDNYLYYNMQWINCCPPIIEKRQSYKKPKPHHFFTFQARMCPIWF